MNLEGNQILNGFAPVDLVTHRISKLKKIFWNTIRQSNGLEFGSSARLKEQSYTLWVSAFDAGSFDVTLKLGVSGQMSLSNMGGFDTIFDQVMTRFDLLSLGEYDQLQQHIGNDEYYYNFVALAKEIAPDGDDVETVKFGALIDGQQRRVNFYRQQQHFNDVPLPDLLESKNELHITDDYKVVRGILQYADSMAEHNVVKLRDADTGVTWNIIVPDALMKDLVQPKFGEEVRIAGRRLAKKRTLKLTLYLRDIEKVHSPPEKLALAN